MSPETSLAGLQEAIPLCVDLDGTLIKTDSLAEAALQLVRNSPLYLFWFVLWLFRGKANLKHQIAIRTELDVEHLPYNSELLTFLKTEASGRDIVLVTGSHRSIATQVSSHLKLFKTIISSDESTNLVGAAKRDALVKRYGKQGFDYVGNDRKDWPVWDQARSCLLVAQEGRFVRLSRKQFSFSKHFVLPSPGFLGYAKAIRVHQWTKNLLLFIPLLLEHRIFDVAALLGVATCFACLSLFASATYLVNDLLDLEADRANSTKRRRALACGLIQPSHAILLILILSCSALALAQLLPSVFLLVLVVYGAVTFAYSLFLKQIMIVDVCILAGLFTLRIIGGALVVQVELSFWLLAFSMFFFLSLAMGKRASELVNATREQKKIIVGRSYMPADLQLLMSAGTSAGFMSVLVIALYINSDNVSQRYLSPEVLWLVCPMLLYWIGRFWLIVNRGGMHEDPIIFAIRDKISLLALAIGSVIVALASTMSVSFL